MGKRRYTAVFPDGRRELVVIDECDTVMNIRAVMEAMLGTELDSMKQLTLSCQGKRLRDSMGTWEAAMSYLFPQRFVSADQQDAACAEAGENNTEKEDGKEKREDSTSPRPLSSFSFLFPSTGKGSSVDGKSSAVGEGGKTKEGGEGGSPGTPVCDPFLLKIYCTVGEKDLSSEISLEAIRDILPENQRASQEERENLRQMFEPTVNFLAANPPFVKRLLEEQGMNVDSPALKQMLQNKELLKMALSSSYDLDAQRRMMQEGTLQLAQAQAHPDVGFMVNSMMENSVKELMESSYSRAPPSVSEEEDDDEDEEEEEDEENHKKEERGDKKNPSGPCSTHSRGRKKKVRAYRVQKEPMPNPWARKDPPPSQSLLNNGFNFPSEFPFSSSVLPSMSAKGMHPFEGLPDMNGGGGGGTESRGDAGGRMNSGSLFQGGMESIRSLFAPLPFPPGGANAMSSTNFASQHPPPPTTIMDFLGGNLFPNNNNNNGLPFNAGEPRSRPLHPAAVSFLVNSPPGMPSLSPPSTASSPPPQMRSPEKVGGSGYLPSCCTETSTPTTSSSRRCSDTSSSLEGTALFNYGLNVLLNEFGFTDRKLCEEALKASAGDLEDALEFLARKQEEEERKIEREK